MFSHIMDGLKRKQEDVNYSNFHYKIGKIVPLSILQIRELPVVHDNKKTF